MYFLLQIEARNLKLFTLLLTRGILPLRVNRAFSLENEETRN